jgi:hypothetical protein
MKQITLIILLVLVLAACGGAQNTGASANQPTSSAIDNAYATALAGPMTNNPAVRPSNGGTSTAAAGGSATEVVATPIESSTHVIIPTATHAAIATAKPRPRPSATATAPLTFIGMGVYVVKCGLVPTTDKPGLVRIQISIEVTGGNGVYQYFDNDSKLWPAKFMDVTGELGTASIGSVKVTSGDGQTIEKEYYIQPNDLKCS